MTWSPAEVLLRLLLFLFPQGEAPAPVGIQRCDPPVRQKCARVRPQWHAPRMEPVRPPEESSSWRTPVAGVAVSLAMLLAGLWILRARPRLAWISLAAAAALLFILVTHSLATRERGPHPLEPYPLLPLWVDNLAGDLIPDAD